VNIPLRHRLTTLLFPRLRDVFVELEGVRGERDRLRDELATLRAPKPHTGTVADIPDADLVERAVRAAYVGRESQERWVHVRDTFSLGSTYAAQLCRRFGLDPEEEVGSPQEERCEGCGVPATTHDSDDVPLCDECYDALDEVAEPEEDRAAASAAPPTPKPGDLVTGENVGVLPVGTVVEWQGWGTSATYDATKVGPNLWERGAARYDDNVIADQGLPARIHTLPPTAEEARTCGTCVHAFEAPGYGPGWHCSLTTGNSGSFYDNVRYWQANKTSACPAHTPRNPPGCGVGGEVAS
jgi:hypothetical protein